MSIDSDPFRRTGERTTSPDRVLLVGGLGVVARQAAELPGIERPDPTPRDRYIGPIDRPHYTVPRDPEIPVKTVHVK